MPRKTKETKLTEIDEPIKKASVKKVAAKKTSKSDDTTEKKKSMAKKASNTTSKKSKVEATKKAEKTTSKKVSKSTTKKASERKTTKSTSRKAKNKQEPSFSVEYYDLPFRYNETVVKILAQTPTNLFVYWEISDETREQLKNQYGEYVFQITKPVLVVHNVTFNYSFEFDINDFANSWYFNVNDSNSEYKVELGRRPIPVNYSYIPDYDVEKNGVIEPIQTPYIYISSSNSLDAPNDKILFNKIGRVLFRNVKTNQITEKDIKDFPSIYIDGKFINIYKLYKELYKEEIKNDGFNLYNPSSGNLSSGSFSSRSM